VDTRVFLIHLFKLLIEALSKNAVSQRTLSKILAEILEGAKADTLGRLEKHPSDCGPDIQAEETKKHIESTPFQLKSFFPSIFSPSIWRKISFTTPNYKSIFLSYHSDKEDSLHQFLKDFRAFDELLSFWNMEEVQVRQAEREIKTGHGIIIVLDDYSATYTPLLREEPIKPKEGEPRQLKERENREWSLDAARFQALKQYGDALDEVIASPDIPDAEKHDFINKTTSHSVEICKARQKGIQFEESIQRKAQALKKKGEIFSQPPKQEKALQPPDLSEIPLYRGRRGRPREVMPLDFLKTHYGQWLSAFGAEENIVFQDQIRHHDQGLIKGIENQLRAEGEGRKVSDFVKTRSARVDRELENTDPEYLRKAHREASRLEVASKRRELKANRSPKSL
jgi:hypothetical protein